MVRQACSQVVDADSELAIVLLLKLEHHRMPLALRRVRPVDREEEGLVPPARLQRLQPAAELHVCLLGPLLLRSFILVEQLRKLVRVRHLLQRALYDLEVRSPRPVQLLQRPAAARVRFFGERVIAGGRIRRRWCQRCLVCAERLDQVVERVGRVGALELRPVDAGLVELRQEAADDVGVHLVVRDRPRHTAGGSGLAGADRRVSMVCAAFERAGACRRRNHISAGAARRQAEPSPGDEEHGPGPGPHRPWLVKPAGGVSGSAAGELESRDCSSRPGRSNCRGPGRGCQPQGNFSSVRMRCGQMRNPPLPAAAVNLGSDEG